MVGVRRQFLAETGDGFVGHSLLHAAEAQVPPRREIVRLQFQGAEFAGDGFLQLSLGMQRHAQAGVCLGVFRLEFHCPPQTGDRLFQSALVR